MSKPIRATARTDLSGLRTRHPDVFRVAYGRRALVIAVITLMTLVFLYAVWRLEFSLSRVGSGLGQIVHIVGMMFPPLPGRQLNVFLNALAETLAIAFLGTLIAAILAFPVGFLAAKNIIPNIFAHFIVRRVLDTFRGVDVLIWALIFINVVGLGPFAGVLAIAASDFGTFGKLFSEAIEAADRKPLEGVVSAGGSDLQAIRFALVPQVLPVMASQVLYFFESNTRSATIIGIVGAGGIGLHLAEQIRVLEWDKVSFLILLILITVAIIDAISTRLRLAVIGRTPVLM